MRSEAETTKSPPALTGLKQRWANYVNDLKARALIARADACARQAEIARNLAEESLESEIRLIARSRHYQRRAEALAPWLKGKR